MSDETTGKYPSADRYPTLLARWCGLLISIVALTLSGTAGAVPQQGTDGPQVEGGATVEAADDGLQEGEAQESQAEDVGVQEGEAAEVGGAEAPQPGESIRRGPPGASAPADGEWLIDDQGRRYFLDKVRKGRFKRLEDGVVKPANMPALKVEREDDEYFYFRVYEPTSVEPWKRGTEATAADLARYRDPMDLPEVDTLVFSDFGRGLPARGQWRNGFDLADMDGDGHLDLVHGPPRKQPGLPLIFLGDDDGTWKLWEEARFPEAPYDYGDAAVADFNGDGRMDIALGMHLLGAVVVVQEGAGNFRLWNEGIALRTDKDANIRFSGREVASSDWNGDGRPDLLVLSEGPAAMPRSPDEAPQASPAGIRVYLNGGDGTWKALDSPYADRSFGDAMVVGDFDGDGIDDVVTGSRAIGYRDVVKLGTEEGLWRAVTLEPLPAKALVWSLARGDFDADGRLDLVVGYRDNLWGVRREAVDLLLNRSEPGELRWERRLLMVRAGYDRFSSLGAGDVDGDGHLDLVALDDVGETHVLLGNGEGDFRRELSPELAPSAGHRHCAGYEVRLHDFDGDGRSEIVAGFAGEPGGEQYLLGILETRCRDRGALRAWTPVPVPEPASVGAED